MTNITLNLSHLEGLKPDTKEWGQGNLKVIMDYALDTIDDITRLAGVAHHKGEIDTPVVSKKGIILRIGTELYKESQQYAELWKNIHGQIWNYIMEMWGKEQQFGYVTEDGGLWIDMEEAFQAWTAKQEAA